jgi:hypothetical protein
VAVLPVAVPVAMLVGVPVAVAVAMAVVVAVGGELETVSPSSAVPLQRLAQVS